MMTGINKATRRRWLSFLVGGAVNTAFTYGIYVALIHLLEYQLSYFIAYVLGICFSFCFNSLIVFKVRLTWKRFFAYPLVYVVQYAASALLLALLVSFANVDVRFAPLLVAVCTVPLTYLLSKWMLSMGSSCRET